MGKGVTLWTCPVRRISSLQTVPKLQCLNWFRLSCKHYLFFRVHLVMYIYGVLHLCNGVTSAGRYASEEGVSRWGTVWLFLGWKFASHPKLMILKTRVCRWAIAKVFRNFFDVCQTWTTKSPQCRLVLIYAWIVFQLAGGGGQDETLVSHIVQFLYTKLIQLPAVSLWRDWKVTYLTRTLRNSAVFKEMLPWKGPSAWSRFHMQRKFDLTSEAS